MRLALDTFVTPTVGIKATNWQANSIYVIAITIALAGVVQLAINHTDP